MLVDQVGRQVHANEHHLETTNEKAQRQQPEAGVRARLAQGLAQGLFGTMSGQRPVAQQADEGHDQRHHQAQHQQRCGPAQPLDQAEGARQHGELAERTGSAGNAHGHAALLRRHGTPDHAEDDRERGAGQADADQQAGTQRQRPGRVGHAHQHQPGSVENTANDHHPRRAHAVGQGAGERLRQPPDQVLQGNGEGEHLTPPAEVRAHRRQEQAEAVPHTQG
ncbi:hypothetical protein D3C79_785610 [compost metagenome]